MKYIKIFTVIALLTVITAAMASAQNIEIYGNRYATEVNRLESTLEQGEKVVIMSVSSLSGKLYIIAGDDDQAVFEYREIFKCPGESTAREYERLVEAEMRKTPVELRVYLRAPNPAPWSETDNSATIEGELRLPPDCQLEIEADYFDLIVEGPFTSFENQSSLGRMAISDITRTLILSGGARDVNLNNISGEISVTINNADITAENLVTKGESARIKNENGSIFINSIEGNFAIRNSYGKIRISKASLSDGTSRIVASHCPIKVELVNSEKAGLSITNNYEDITIEIDETIPALFNLNVEAGGEMHVTDIPIKPVVVRSDHIECVVGDGVVPINIDVEEGGNIFIEGIQKDR